MRGVLLAATIVALIPLVLVIYYLLYKGLGALSGSFFTTDPNGNFFGDPGGVRSAILGTLEIVAVATLVSVPIGIAVALYLSEYGKEGRFANLTRYFVDVMTGVPSIVFGLFIYIVLVISHAGGIGFAGWKGALALSLLMLPIVVRSSEVVLLLVPGSLREAALALGAPRWRIVITKVVLPTARAGPGDRIAAGGRPRHGGDGAAAVHGRRRRRADRSTSTRQMNALPLQIYNDILSPRACRRRPRLGRRADPGRPGPHSQSGRASDLAQELHDMIPPETTSKEREDMSTAGGPISDQAEAAP